jgi:NAD(P)-dependent dehydrogenase (short-subunit alcohol dehydrogenase family)
MDVSEGEFRRPATVMVTGAGGNLGGKAVEALAAAPWCRRIIGLTHGGETPSFSETARPKVHLVRADLSRRESAWEEAMADCDAVLHAAAFRPVPEASWQEAAISFDMVQLVGLAALRLGVRRLVFLSSNHVMGRYKDAPLCEQIRPGTLTADLPPAPGTRWWNGTTDLDATPYAAAKLMGERAVAAFARESAGALTTVSIRIGWAQAGENLPETISIAGSPEGAATPPQTEEDRRTLAWFRAMWLSNHDFARLMRVSLSADPAHWPGPSILVNGMSRNRDMGWSLTEAETWLDYAPEDDCTAAAGSAGQAV